MNSRRGERTRRLAGEIRGLERDGILPRFIAPYIRISFSLYIYIYSLHFPINLHRLLRYHLTSFKNLDTGPLARRFPSLETERRDKFQSSGRVLARTPRLATKTRTAHSIKHSTGRRDLFLSKTVTCRVYGPPSPTRRGEPDRNADPIHLSTRSTKFSRRWGCEINASRT